MNELHFQGLTLQDDLKAKERAKKAQEKRKQAKTEPTWAEVWEKGFTTATGGRKPGILENVAEGIQRTRLLEVKAAIEGGEIGPENPSLRKFSKAQALRLWEVLQARRKDDYLREMVKNTPDNYRLIQTEGQFRELLADLGREQEIAVDTETTGLDVYRDKIVGISFTLPRAGYSVYIPVGHKVAGGQLNQEYVFRKLEPVMTSPLVGKVFHNAKYDLQMFLRHGLRVRGVIHDTMIAMRVLNENEPSFALKNIATKHREQLGICEESKTFEELFGKDAKFAEVPLDVALVYAAKDTELTWKLYLWQKRYLKEVGFLDRLYWEIENPLIPVVVDMEQTGFLIDMKFAQQYGRELEAEIAQVEKGLIDVLGEGVNLNSPAQLAEILFDRLGLQDVSKKRSTEVKFLKKLKGQHESIEPLLEYRELTKLKGTYVDALPGLVKADGRVHGSFNQLRAVTGRFSSDKPNLQNLPPEARRLIVAPEGFLILGADYSQIEPRILAHMSGDKHLQEPYLMGQDLYSTLASKVFKRPLSECGDGSKWRKMMKVGLLAVMYGTSMYTLSEQLGITVEEALQFIVDFYKAYPDVYSFIKETHEFVKVNEYVLTLYHRKRRFPGHREMAIKYDRLAREICKATGTTEVPLDFWQDRRIPYRLKKDFWAVKGEVERVRRMAVNARIQGSAADVMKRALITLYGYCQEKGWRVNATVHDEALILVPETLTLQEVQEVESLMVKAAPMEVPVKVDVELYKRWGEGVKKNQYFKQVA